MKHFLPLFVIPVVALAACTPAQTPDDPDMVDDHQSSSETDMGEERSYQGVIEEAGVSIYMEGTHRIVLADRQFVLLESENTDLDAYIGKEVEVHGMVRTTVESGGRIMMVDTVTVLETDSASSEAVSSESASKDTVSSMSQVSSAQAVTSTASVRSVTSRAAGSARSQAAASAVSSAATAVLDARVSTMAKANLAPANWSRTYCTQNVSFCVPVHKNWYFKSFGATTSTLWHVEVGPEELFSLGDGPVVINLVTGTAAADGQVTVQGGAVIGYRVWKDNSHFEITAPAELEAVVRYMTTNLVEMPKESSSAGTSL